MLMFDIRLILPLYIYIAIKIEFVNLITLLLYSLAFYFSIEGTCRYMHIKT